MTAAVHRAEQKAQQYNQQCHCDLLNLEKWQAQLNNLSESALFQSLIAERPHLFAKSPVFVSASHLNQQHQIITAIENVVASPLYQQQVLAYAPEVAQYQPQAMGVFLGYDFHLSGDGSKLIEINSNAGGAFINALLLQAQNTCCDPNEGNIADNADSGACHDLLPQQFLSMFLAEWREERDDQPLHRLAIVDENPDSQYLLPEFLLFKHLFQQHQIQTFICDPSELRYQDGALWYQQQKIDLVYNRLTDFGLENPTTQPLRQAYLANAVVLTPHPRNHALYADKRNLVWLSDDAFLQAIGVDADTRAILQQGIAKTRLVTVSDAEVLWQNRKQLFFKPAKGYGSKAAYRGDKLTKRVFGDILNNEYVAQSLIHPSTRQLEIDNALVDLKLDLRHYVYAAKTILTSARLYQGQTTNFRTPGGGFAPVIAVR